MSRLEVTLLGPFQTNRGGASLPHFRSLNTLGLFVYLVMQAERSFTRDALAGLFWPDHPDSAAKKNLRQTLYQLKQALGDADQPYLLTNRQTVQFNLDTEPRLDVDQFLSAIERGELETAVLLYRGELLAGHSFESSSFEAWLRVERERLHLLALEVMSDLCERQLARADHAAAQTTARRQLTLEPWRERAHQQFMRALALAGDRSGALAQFEACQDALEEALGVSPMQETFDLVRKIESGGLVGSEPDLLVGRYRLAQKIGQGSMGIIYRGEDTRLGQAVAIKMLDPSRIDSQHDSLLRFRREGEALKQLDHPNIVRFVELAEEDGRHYLVMEYIAGGDLRTLLAQRSQLPIKQILSIGLDLADALTRAHRLSILHRDIKPANVLLTQRGTPRLADFGIARLGREQQLTQHGSVFGTYAYMSPEMFSHEEIDERTDIWSFGVLLLEMLIGVQPFAMPTIPATITAVLNQSIPEISTLRADAPYELILLLEKMLAKDKAQRVGSVRQVGVELERLLDGLEAGSLHETPVLPRQDNQTDNYPSFTDQPDSIHTIQPSIPRQAPALPPHFVGREEDMEVLTSLLISDQADRAVALVGMGGMGKTTLATALAHRLHTQFPDGVLWASLHNSTPNSILQTWARAFGHDFSGIEDSGSLVMAVRSLLSDKRALIVLDNVDDGAAARPLLLNGANGALLLTTRNLDIASALNATPYTLQELSADQSQRLLVKVLGETRLFADAGETQAAVRIGELLYQLPLAVEIAAQRLKSRPRMRLQDMVSRLESAQRRLGLKISDHAVRTSFQVSWDGLDDRLKRLFAHMGLFGGRSFSAEALAGILNADFFDLEDDIYTLSTLSLVNEFGEQRFRQHPLLADFAAEKLETYETATDAYIAYYKTFVHDFYAAFEMLEPEWENINAAIGLVGASDAPEQIFAFTEQLAQSWFRFGRFQDAVRAYTLAEEVAADLGMAERLADGRLRRAEILIEQNRYSEAWGLLEDALVTFYRGEDDAKIAEVRYFQGYVLYDQSAFAEAEGALLESMALFSELSMAKFAMRTAALLARVYLETDATVDRARRIIENARRLLSKAQPSAASAELCEISSLIAVREGNFGKAESDALEALSFGESLNLPEQVGSACHLLTAVYRKQHKFAESEAVAQRGIDIFDRLGNQRYKSMVLHELGNTLMETEKYDEAKELLQRTLQVYEEIEDRLGYAYGLIQLGEIYGRTGDIPQANASWQEALQIARLLGHTRLQSQLEQRLDRTGQ